MTARQSFSHTAPTPLAARFRLIALGALLALVTAFAAAPPARATGSAEHFVQINVEKGLGILNNKKLSETKRRAEFRDLLLGLADLRRTATFTLGAARRTAKPGEIDAFVDAFRDYAIAVYQARLSAYSGQTLKVTGSTQRAPGDYVVTTVLVDPNAASDKQPIQIDFRVDRDNGGFKVLDVSVVGVWLAIEERDQFTAFLAQHNNSVSALTRHLKELTAKIEAGGSANGSASAH